MSYMDAESLFKLTKTLVEIPSVSENEGELASFLQSELDKCPFLSVERIGNSVIAYKEGSPKVLLAGHIDTVPEVPGQKSGIKDGLLWGRGAVDMKGGVAVMLALAREAKELPPGLTFVFYECEEVAQQKNGLLKIEKARPDLLSADCAVLLEPSGGRLSAGCQGVLLFKIAVAGIAEHVARPFSGKNAIYRLLPVLEALKSFPLRSPVITGLSFKESCQAVRVLSGRANNVVPDLAEVVVSYRFAPDISAEEAKERVKEHLGPVLEEGDRIEFLDISPAAPPFLEHPLFKRLLDLSKKDPEAKLGWTDVAFFSSRRVPAVNYGPGRPELCHKADERVSKEELFECYEVLKEALSKPPF